MYAKKGLGVRNVKDFQEWIAKAGPVSGARVIRNALCMNKEPEVVQVLGADPDICQLWSDVNHAIETYLAKVKTEQKTTAGKEPSKEDIERLDIELARAEKAVKVAPSLPAEVQNVMLASTQSVLEALQRDINYIPGNAGKLMDKRLRKVMAEIARLTGA